MSVPDEKAREFAAAGPVRVSIEAGAGEVRVDAADVDRTTVAVRPSRPGDDAAGELIARTTIEQRGDLVAVAVPRRGAGFLRRAPELVIALTVPSVSSLVTAVDSADLRTSGQLGTVRSKGGSGDVLLEHVTQANVQTGSGDTRIERVDGALRVQSGSGDVTVRTAATGCSVSSGSGDVRLEQCAGPVQVSTASGDVGVDDADSDVSVSTASGDIYVGRVRRGQVKLTSASGDVHIGVLDGTPVWLEIASVSGTVHSALDRGEAPGEGEDSVALRVNTVSGDITLVRA